MYIKAGQKRACIFCGPLCVLQQANGLPRNLAHWPLSNPSPSPSLARSLAVLSAETLLSLISTRAGYVLETKHRRKHPYPSPLLEGRGGP